MAVTSPVSRRLIQRQTRRSWFRSQRARKRGTIFNLPRAWVGDSEAGGSRHKAEGRRQKKGTTRNEPLIVPSSFSPLPTGVVRKPKLQPGGVGLPFWFLTSVGELGCSPAVRGEDTV